MVDLFTRAHALGVREFVLLQDTHEPDAPEFAAWPPHCVRGTPEAETIPELRLLGERQEAACHHPLLDAAPPAGVRPH